MRVRSLLAPLLQPKSESPMVADNWTFRESSWRITPQSNMESVGYVRMRALLMCRSQILECVNRTDR
ncbi:hypothetical protein GCM10020000_76920 [Streptomyces olivoverticillatus]